MAKEKQLEEIKESISDSPLLNDAIDEKDYTTEDFSGEGQQKSASEPVSEVKTEPEAFKTETPKEDVDEKPKTDPDPPKDRFAPPDDIAKELEEPQGFTIDPKKQGDEDGKDDEGVSDFSDSHEIFAEVAAAIIGDVAPEIMYQSCKIDMNNVERHIQSGNIREDFRPVLKRANVNMRENLTPSPKGIQTWQNAFKKYLEYNNVKQANPTTALALASVTLLVDMGARFTKASQSAKEMLLEAAEQSNPSFAAEMQRKQSEKKEQ